MPGKSGGIMLSALSKSLFMSWASWFYSSSKRQGLNWAPTHCSQCWGLAASLPPKPGRVGAASQAVQQFPLESGRWWERKEGGWHSSHSSAHPCSHIHLTNPSQCIYWSCEACQGWALLISLYSQLSLRKGGLQPLLAACKLSKVWSYCYTKSQNARLSLLQLVFRIRF